MFPPVSTNPGTDTGSANSSWFAGWQQLWYELISRPQPIDALLKDSSFNVISSRKYFCPIGWRGDLENGVELGEVMLKNTVQWTRACAPAVLASEKYDRKSVDSWLDAIEEECKSKQMYVPWDLVLARPKVGETEEIVE